MRSGVTAISNLRWKNRAVFIWVSKSNWFCINSRLAETLETTFHPIRSKNKTSRDSLALIFPRFALATSGFDWFTVLTVFCDWLESSLSFWFYDTQLKTALLNQCWSDAYVSQMMHVTGVSHSYSRDDTFNIRGRLAQLRRAWLNEVLYNLFLFTAIISNFSDDNFIGTFS